MHARQQVDVRVVPSRAGAGGVPESSPIVPVTRELRGAVLHRAAEVERGVAL